MKREEEIARILAVPVRRVLLRLAPDYGRLQEIRLRTGQPLAVLYEGENHFVSPQGCFVGPEQAFVVEAEHIRETVDYISSYSRYAFEEKIRQGFLTVPGGHRVGLAGRVVLEADAVKTIAPITFLNIRIAREMVGCAQPVLPWLWQQGELSDTLIISAPGLGKTTLLRDLIRMLSDGEGGRSVSVGVVDERSELAACCQGIPQNHLGRRTDVLDGCPKAQGMLMLVRTMAPEVIAVDEVGGTEDCRAVEYAMNCGCRIFATVHGENLEELRLRPFFKDWAQEKRFGRYVMIEREDRQIRYRICDREGKTLWQGPRCVPEDQGL